MPPVDDKPQFRLRDFPERDLWIVAFKSIRANRPDLSFCQVLRLCDLTILDARDAAQRRGQ